jgi:hypothetical protein
MVSGRWNVSTDIRVLNDAIFFIGVSYRCAKLNEEFADRFAVVHCVEGCDFVDAHRGHLEEAGDLIHNADAGVAMLTLTKVQEGHDSSLLVLRGITGEDLLDELVVLLGELEGEGGIVLGGVAVLDRKNY